MEELKAGGFHVSQGALQALARPSFASGRASEAETAAMIARARAEMGELLCPHSAVGVQVAKGFPGDADGHARHRASGEVPRRGRGGTGVAPSSRRAWPTCMTVRNG
jgi:hypothetical protein